MFATFESDTDYFGSHAQQAMINVRDHAEAVLYLVNASESRQGEYRKVTRDGQEIWVGQHVRPIITGGRIEGFQGMARENMTRAHGWRFLDLGRRIERARNLLGLLKASVHPPPRRMNEA